MELYWVSWLLWFFLCQVLIFTIIKKTPEEIGISSQYEKIDFFSLANKTERIFSYGLLILISFYFTIAILNDFRFF